MKLIPIALLLLFSCSPDQSVGQSDLTSSIKTFAKEKCVGDACAKVNLTWPEFAGDGSEAINQAIQEQLIAYFYSDSTGLSLEDQADRYLGLFEESLADFPDIPGGWEMAVEAAVSFDSLSTISVLFNEFNYSGGAHPNSSSYFMNFDRETGEFLSIDRLVIDQSALLQLAEKAFRDFHEVDAEVTLEEDGRFFLPETGFFLPNAMGFNDGKFQLTYIPYEIGPYVMGYTELTFSLEELKGIVRQ